MKCVMLLAQAILIGLLAQTAIASKPILADGRLDLYGDFRLRTDYDWDSLDKDGRSPKKDRHRLRVRARVGLKGQISDYWSFNTRVRTVNPDNARFSHLTLWQDDGSKRIRSNITMDRAKLEYSNESLSIGIGRDTLALWGPSELRHASLTYFDGMYANWKRRNQLGDWNVLAMGGETPIGGEHMWHGARAGIGAVQFAHSNAWGRSPLRLSNSLSYAYDEAPLVEPRDSADFLVYSGTLDKRMNVGDSPVHFGATFYKNFAESDRSYGQDNQDEGMALFAEYGSSNKIGGNRYKLTWARMEAWAVDCKLAYGSWFLFELGSRVVAADYEGLEFEYIHRFSKNLSMSARAAKIRALTDGQEGKRVRMDLNVAF